MKQILQGATTGLVIALVLFTAWAPHDMLHILNNLI
jgi:hypothetical protein